MSNQPPTGMIRIGSGVPGPTQKKTPPQLQVWGPIGVVVVLVLGVLAAGLIHGETAPTATPSPPPPTIMFSVAGSIQLERGQYAWSSNTKTCWGFQGYDDLATGGQVVITDAAGKVVGTGQVDSSRVQIDINGEAEGCQLLFSVATVPDGSDFYGVAVGHRKPVQYQRSELDTAISLKI